MTTRMKHPIHGYTNTGDGMMVDDFRRLGWVVDEPVTAIPKPVVQESAPTDLKTEYFKKFGKAPHHLLKAENLRKALDDHSS